MKPEFLYNLQFKANLKYIFILLIGIQHVLSKHIYIVYIIYIHIYTLSIYTYIYTYLVIYIHVAIFLHLHFAQILSMQR